MKFSIYSCLRAAVGSVIFLSHALFIPVNAQTLSLNGAATTCSSATVTPTANGANITTQPANCIVVPAAGGPQLTSVTPSCVTAGGVVNASGANLTGATSATINTLAATFTVNSATSISVTVPAGVTTGSASLVVVTPNGTTNAVSFNVGNCAVTPTITSVAPTSAAVGAAVTINGTNLASPTSVTVNGVAATVLASSTATAINITVPNGATVGAGSIVVTTAAGTTNSVFTVIGTTSGGFVSIEGVTIPNPSKRANVVPAPRAGQLNGGGPDLNAYAIDHATNCTNSTAPITRLWAHSIDFTEYATGAIDFFSMGPGQALTYKFVAPASGANSIVYNESTNASFVPTLMSISSSPCDFDTPKSQPGPQRDFCYVSSNAYNAVIYGVLPAPQIAPIPYCTLRPGNTYYFNIRFLYTGPGGNTTQDSCNASSSGVCGGLLQFR